jgi:hypothetical protein
LTNVHPDRFMRRHHGRLMRLDLKTGHSAFGKQDFREVVPAHNWAVLCAEPEILGVFEEWVDRNGALSPVSSTKLKRALAGADDTVLAAVFGALVAVARTGAVGVSVAGFGPGASDAAVDGKALESLFEANGYPGRSQYGLRQAIESILGGKLWRGAEVETFGQLVVPYADADGSSPIVPLYPGLLQPLVPSGSDLRLSAGLFMSAMQQALSKKDASGSNFLAAALTTADPGLHLISTTQLVYFIAIRQLHHGVRTEIPRAGSPDFIGLQRRVKVSGLTEALRSELAPLLSGLESLLTHDHPEVRARAAQLLAWACAFPDYHQTINTAQAFWHSLLGSLGSADPLLRSDGMAALAQAAELGLLSPSLIRHQLLVPAIAAVIAALRLLVLDRANVEKTQRLLLEGNISLFGDNVPKGRANRERCVNTLVESEIESTALQAAIIFATLMPPGAASPWTSLHAMAFDAVSPLLMLPNQNQRNTASRLVRDLLSTNPIGLLPDPIATRLVETVRTAVCQIAPAERLRAAKDPWFQADIVAIAGRIAEESGENSPIVELIDGLLSHLEGIAGGDCLRAEALIPVMAAGTIAARLPSESADADAVRAGVREAFETHAEKCFAAIERKVSVGNIHVGVEVDIAATLAGMCLVLTPDSGARLQQVWQLLRRTADWSLVLRQAFVRQLLNRTVTVRVLDAALVAALLVHGFRMNGEKSQAPFNIAFDNVSDRHPELLPTNSTTAAAYRYHIEGIPATPVNYFSLLAVRLEYRKPPKYDELMTALRALSAANETRGHKLMPRILVGFATMVYLSYLNAWPPRSKEAKTNQSAVTDVFRELKSLATATRTPGAATMVLGAMIEASAVPAFGRAYGSELRKLIRALSGEPGVGDLLKAAAKHPSASVKKALS